MTKRPMTGWQPIETAPKDGTHILAYWPEIYWAKNVAQCETWFGPRFLGPDCCWQSASAYEYGDAVKPTHWMPLPEPPA
jgi:hypothetical protein